MKILYELYERLSTSCRIIGLTDIRPLLNNKDFFKLSVAMFLNASNSLAKILAPAAFAKGIEMLALGEEEHDLGVVSFRIIHLFYVSVALTAWTKSEIYLKQHIIKNIEGALVENSLKEIISAVHKLPINDHITNRSAVTKLMTETLNYQAKLVGEVVTVVWQVLLDILLGSVIIYFHYGKFIGTEFLLYCVLDILLLSNLVAAVTKQKAKLETMNKKLYKFINHEYEIISYEETVRMFDHVEFETKQSEKHLSNYLHAHKNFKWSEDIAILTKNIPLLIANIIPISVLLRGQLTLHDLDEVIFLLGYINQFGEGVANLSHAMMSCSRAINSIEAQYELRDYAKSLVSETPSPQLPFYRQLQLLPNSPTIEFDKVSFAYPGSPAPTLKQLSFIISPGTKLGIVGHSNAGKSTVVKLLFKIYKPQSGAIRINGYDLNDIPAAIVTKIFCCVPQTAELFKNRSLKYNVMYGSDKDTLLQLSLAISKNKRQLSNDARRDYHTINIVNDPLENASTSHEVNDRFKAAMTKAELQALTLSNTDLKTSALGLSGGQRQRASIARALVRNSCVFVFDEMTSNLDSDTEAKVVKSVHAIASGKTSIMITHRLATVLNADKILVLANGELVEMGTPKELMEKQGHFYSYARAQMRI